MSRTLDRLDHCGGPRVLTPAGVELAVKAAVTGDHRPIGVLNSCSRIIGYSRWKLPPVGYEWVRDDTDAILVNTSTGEILQVEYGFFA
jgi:Nickel/cobalt transporter regulator